jgi:hypothetical protein
MNITILHDMQIKRIRINCRDCEWWCEWYGNPGVRYGECHRFPPSAISLDETLGNIKGKTNACERAVWPITNEDNGCGEFRMKEK